MSSSEEKNNATAPDERVDAPSDESTGDKRDASDDVSDEAASPKRRRTTTEDANDEEEEVQDANDEEEDANDDEEEEAQEEVQEEAQGEDLCQQMGLLDGSRLEVEWQLVNDDDSMTTRWWGCKLLPHDGRVEDGVAVRVLEYDALEPHYPEPSREDVLFLSSEILISPESQAEFKYRVKDVVVGLTNDQTREFVTNILMQAFNRQQASFPQMDRATQGALAESFCRKKEALLDALAAHNNGPIITADRIREIMRRQN
ncbi:expressed unknown protein [Seminavis robusta]|uniref:Uncharacterized protein n=1 Tax=Seminavis robusta TaxID=568900 RepID=A0A9N8DY35_9STRA|nr:expressed unknown protein [Seminavis robusta]|eukprot:Sro369_g128110.1 n/a (258) ;mRNA; f:10369-11142